uniref:UPAR/Ly6 domain-containing protein n=1 Tax=Sus scrofa TaxID=9823 RepID=A0A4X1W4P9_PIG
MRTSVKPETFLLASALLCTLLGLESHGLGARVRLGETPRPLSAPPPRPAEGHQSTNRYQGCVKSSACSSGFLSITTSPENHMVSNMRCCQSDGCNHNAAPPRLPPNGLQCPSCTASFKDTCSATKEVLCVGQETHCATFTGNVQAGIKFSTQGCATENASHIKPGTLVPSASSIYTISQSICFPGPQPSGN